jgi:hypothetical protein
VSPRRSTPESLVIGAAWLAIAAISGLTLYAGLALWVHAWRFHPALAEGATAAVCALAVLATVAFIRGGQPHRTDDDGDEDDTGRGGGGPPKSPPPVPRGPRGTAPDWDGFDRARADWERVTIRR